MNEFLEKMKKIINSKGFYNDAKEFFEEYCCEEYDDIGFAKRKAIEYLYNKYFEKFEKEYYALGGEHDLWNYITEYYEDIVYKISFDFMNNYGLDYFDFGDDEEYEVICNSCGEHVYQYMEIKFKPNIEYDRSMNLNLCEKCAIELRDFINWHLSGEKEGK